MECNEQIVCPDCGMECPEPEHYDQSSRFNAWRCECRCGLTCLGNSPDDVRATWRNMVLDKYHDLEAKQERYGIV